MDATARGLPHYGGMENSESWADERETSPERSVRYREEIRRELAADKEVIAPSRQAIILSRAALARCIVQLPIFARDSAIAR